MLDVLRELTVVWDACCRDRKVVKAQDEDEASYV